MKLKTNTMLAAMLAAGTLFYGCHKKDNDNTSSEETQYVEQSGDESRVSNESEQALSDVDAAVNASAFAGGRTEAFVCGATIDSTVPLQRTITFDGTTDCNGRVRSGSIVVKLYNADRWKQPGAVLGVTANGYTVTRNGKTFVFNGEGKVYNVSGGTRALLRAGEISQLVHRIRFSGFRINLNNEKTVEWNVAKLRTWTVNGDVLNVSTAGDTTINEAANIGTWGLTRRGLPFQTQFQAPIVANSTCGFGSPTSGKKLHKAWARQVLVTFGVDNEGFPVAAGTCAYGYKVEFTNANGNQTRIVAY